MALLLATYLDTGPQREIVLCEYDTYGPVCAKFSSIAVIDFPPWRYTAPSFIQYNVSYPYKFPAVSYREGKICKF